MTTYSYYWHDYETFGTDPQRDRACQFAGIRTDLEFNVIGEPLMLYCKIPDDYLPNPEACLITGITPQLTMAQGVCEAQFIRIIHEQLSQPNTCSLGYNTIRFDDEVTRNLLYRNFFDPYAREWQDSNSRWDLIDIVRAAYALRPEGIHWPKDQENVVSFRLEQLTQANQIAHQSAHDALSDVYATIAIARLIKHHQPRLYEFLFNHRHKATALRLLNVGSLSPLVHISGKYSAKKHCMAIVVALDVHPKNSNEIIVYDLSVDPTPLLELTAEQIQDRLFVANAALPAGIERIPLKTVHINKCPVLAPINVITPKDADRLEIDLAVCQRHLKLIVDAMGSELNEKLKHVFNREYANLHTDPDLMIYSGGFFDNHDKKIIQNIRESAAKKLSNFEGTFHDDRLPEMLFRYQARNYPETLIASQKQQWHEYCKNRLHHKSDENTLDLQTFNDILQKLQLQHGTDNTTLQALESFYREKQNWFKSMSETINSF